MKKLDSFILTHKNKLGFSVALNILVFVFYMLIFYPVYETNDDGGLLALVSGIKGVHDPHMVYINTVLGHFFAFLWLEPVGSLVRSHAVYFAFLLFYGDYVCIVK